VRILPALPPLLSIATSPAVPGRGIPEAKQASFCAQFQLGWNEGVAQVEAARMRMRKSSSLGYKIMRHDFEEEAEDAREDKVDVGYSGLVEAEESDFELQNLPTPVVCLAGDAPLEKHPPECGHVIGRGVWKDVL
ncbi:hypothetical protein HDZ31DRAFT_68482, partial [Schizophyllum fasciatum]